jgi:hypothetical protein
MSPFPAASHIVVVAESRRDRSASRALRSCDYEWSHQVVGVVVPAATLKRSNSARQGRAYSAACAPGFRNVIRRSADLERLPPERLAPLQQCQPKSSSYHNLSAG